MSIKTFFSNLFYKGNHRKGTTPEPYKSRYDTESTAAGTDFMKSVTPVAFTPATNVNVVEPVTDSVFDNNTTPALYPETVPAKVMDASTIPPEVTGTDPESVGVTAVPDPAVQVWPTVAESSSLGTGWPEKTVKTPVAKVSSNPLDEPWRVVAPEVTPAAEPTVVDAVVVVDTTEKDDNASEVTKK